MTHQSTLSRPECLCLAFGNPSGTLQEVSAITGCSEEQLTDLGSSDLPSDDFHIGFHKGRCKTPHQILEVAHLWQGNITFWNGVADGREAREIANSKVRKPSSW